MTRASWELRDGEPIAPGLIALRPLGGGSRYDVYLAFDEHRRAVVVAKVVRPDRFDDPGTLAGLAGEVRLLRRLAHPMLVRAFDDVLDGPRPRLVLELVEGPRLSTLIRRYGVAVEQLLPLALNLCSALHYLAAEEVVHLDVKPSNVVMADVPTLIDLSVARTFDELRTLRTPVGTDAYMAPEQCDPERLGPVGPPADVWGLGATLHQALTGHPPFAPAPDERWPQLRIDAPPLRGVAPAVVGLVEACLERRPLDRPRAGELAERLEPLVDALPGPRLGRFRPAPRHVMPR